ncbi:N-alpha-acetyltransferase 50 [Coccomyxa sp. Obi]|nr:N-alpha-acetyltransferase 50 [Coccomyxa sp. Obi]
MSAEEKSVLQITFQPLTERNLEQLKTLNGVIFPINYQDKLYRECMLFEGLTQGAFHGDSLIGAVTVRLEQQQDGTAKLCFITLGVLAAYRGCSIGSQLLHRTLEAAQQDPNIVEAYLHVQTSNEEAIRFYQRAGFKVSEMLTGYYRKNRLQPPDAYVLRKRL